MAYYLAQIYEGKSFEFQHHLIDSIYITDKGLFSLKTRQPILIGNITKFVISNWESIKFDDFTTNDVMVENNYIYICQKLQASENKYIINIRFIKASINNGFIDDQQECTITIDTNGQGIKCYKFKNLFLINAKRTDIYQTYIINLDNLTFEKIPYSIYEYPTSKIIKNNLLMFNTGSFILYDLEINSVTRFIFSRAKYNRMNIIDDSIIGYYDNNCDIFELKEQSNINEENQCAICSNYTEKNTALVPCGHTKFCNKCITKMKNCVICQKLISSTIRIYN